LVRGGEFPLAVFRALPHIVFSVEGKRTTETDGALAKLGRKRHVAMTAADFSGIYRTVAQSDIISVIPTELAVAVAGEAGFDVFRPPITVGPTPIHMAWHRRSSQSPSHRWFRGVVAETLRALPHRFSLKSHAEAVISGGS
jgi:DNA-binding transcriptional LysR family regulator